MAKSWRHRHVKWLRDSGAELADGTIGEIVESAYRARWRGVVIEVLGDGSLVAVRVTHDRRGNPVRKPGRKSWIRNLDRLWLRKVRHDRSRIPR